MYKKLKNKLTPQNTRTALITIDGPGGSGKGTMSQWLAVHLGWSFLDSGALYRVLAYYVTQENVSLEDEKNLYRLAQSLPIEFIPDPDTKLCRVQLAGSDVTEQIRTVQCGNNASQVGRFARVRTALLAQQRAFAKPPGLVADGRDMGTVVFPEAQMKLFLTASQEERAKRRHQQLLAKGKDVSLEHVFNELKVRDERDAQRTEAPLKAASEARVIDTTGLSIDAVKARMLSIYQQIFVVESK